MLSLRICGTELGDSIATVIITLKLMPTGVDTDFEVIKASAKKQIAEFGGEVGKEEIEPIAFGLKCLKLTFIMDEDKGSTEDLENQLAEIEGVQSVDCIDVRRAIG